MQVSGCRKNDRLTKSRWNNIGRTHVKEGIQDNRENLVKRRSSFFSTTFLDHYGVIALNEPKCDNSCHRVEVKQA